MVPQTQEEWPPKDGESWLDLEYSGCFYCDRPWDHAISAADSAIYLCLNCYERRYGQRTVAQPDGTKTD